MKLETIFLASYLILVALVLLLSVAIPPVLTGVVAGLAALFLLLSR